MIIYAHNAIFEESGANQLQVMQMVNALATQTKTTLVCFGERLHADYKFKKTIVKTLKPKINYYFRSIQLFNTIKNMEGNLYTRDIILASLTNALTTKKVIYELHEIKSNPLWKLLLNYGKNFQKIIVISEGLQKEIPKHKNTLVLRDGVDNRFFKKPKKIPKLTNSSNKKTALYIGTFTKWKGVQTILDASKLKHNCQFVCVGTPTDQLDRLKTQYPNVIFLPRIPSQDVPKYLYAADMLLLPNTAKEAISAKYTSPLKLFEYLATNKPIVASDLPSIREVVTEKNVTFAKPDNAQDLIEAISRSLKQKPENRELAKKFTWKKRAKRIISDEQLL